MNYQICNIKKYKLIVDEKLSRYKERQRKIWKAHYDMLIYNNERYLYRSTDKSFEQQWYKNCMWELKYQPSIKKKHCLFKEKIEKKIHIYLNIMLKSKYLSRLHYDLLLHIIGFIY